MRLTHFWSLVFIPILLMYNEPMSRQLTMIDRCLTGFQRALMACAGGMPVMPRAYPAEALKQPDLSEQERKHSAGLLRVDHSGEVCAQALYAGQAAGAKTAHVSAVMAKAAKEEEDHLYWTQRRLEELDARTSVLNPIWYGLSFLMGYAMAKRGDDWSLGFVVETERQVEAHLQSHMTRLPAQDAPSRVIVQTMMQDEIEHANHAQAEGARAMPERVKRLMAMVAKIMTQSSYYL